MHFYGYLGNSPDAIQLQYLIKVEYWTPEYQHLNKRASFAWTRKRSSSDFIKCYYCLSEF